MRPTFIVIGAAKCATTSLCALLARHPDVGVSEPKEPWYFSHYYRPGMVGYDKFFTHCAGKRAVGEGSTSYTKHVLHPKTAQRIAAELPEVKLIYITRHPLRQIESHWMQMRKCSELGVPADFNEAVRTSPSLVDTAMYFRQISAYRAHFADDRILRLFFEEYNADNTGVLREVFKFIEVDPDARVDVSQGRVNVSEGDLADTPLVSSMRRSSLFYRVRDMMPAPVVQAAKRLLKKPITSRPEWDAATKDWALRQLRDDARQYLEYCGKPADYWQLD